MSYRNEFGQFGAIPYMEDYKGERVEDLDGFDAWPEPVPDLVVFPRHNPIFPNRSSEGQRGWTGSHMYKRSRKVSAPVASSSSVNFQAANRKISLAGREYICTLNSGGSTVVGATSSVFQTTSAQLRPTDTQLFSWLGTIAKKFEEYKFHSLTFVYEPQCPTTTSGSVALWFDGDPTHVPPTNWNNVINTGANIHGAPWAKHTFVVPRHLFSSRKSYYTKNEFSDLSSIPGNFNTAVDPLEYICGLYGFASVDVQQTLPVGQGTPLGKVYIDYSLTLQTQNVDSWAQTSSVSHLALSTENADNSGTSMVLQNGVSIQKTTFPAGVTSAFNAVSAVSIAGANGVCFFGNANLFSVAMPLPSTTVLATPNQTVAGGDMYFTVGANGMYTAKQNLELEMDCGFTLGAAGTALQSILFVNPVAYPGVTWQINSGATQGSTITGVYTGASSPSGYVLNTAGALGDPKSPTCVSLLWQLGNVVASPSIVTAKVVSQVFGLRLQQGDQIAFGCVDTAAGTVAGFFVSFSPQTYAVYI